MLAGVCKVLKGLFVTAWLCAAPEVVATTYYVDGACTSSGAGLSITCGSSGPKKTIPEAISVASSGDTIQIRGPHTGLPKGEYLTSDEIRVYNKTGITIQGYHYGLADAERPIIAGIQYPTWIYCTTCDTSDNAACQNLTGGGLCQDYRYFTGSYPSALALACSKQDGTPCYMVANKSDMTNAHVGYVSSTCGGALNWLHCNSATDCPNSTCNGSTTEIDAYSSGSYIVARWGTVTPGGVVYDNNGYGFSVCNSTNITFKGLGLRHTRRALFQVANTGNSGCVGVSSDITITDNIGAYTHDTGGSDYGIKLDKIPTATVTNNTFAYTGSESINTEPASSGTTTMTVTGNVFRDNGDSNVLGPKGGYPLNGTPECSTLGRNESAGTFTYTNSRYGNNLCIRPRKNGLILEGSKGWQVDSNIFSYTGRSSISANSKAITGAGGHSIFNNIFEYCCTSATDSGDAAVWIRTESGTETNNSVYNNTFAGSTDSELQFKGDGSTATGNVVRNNIFWTSGSEKLVDWTPTDASNLFEYNLISSSAAGTVVTWRGSNYTCTTIDNLTGNPECASPRLVNPTLKDYHLNTFAGTTPAVDGGTTTLAARTASIYNTLASTYGYPSYADAYPQGGSAWDMGATELMLSDGGGETNTFGAGGWQRDACTCPRGNFDTTNIYQGTYSLHIAAPAAASPCSDSCSGAYVNLANLNTNIDYEVVGQILFDTPSAGTIVRILQTPITTDNPCCFGTTFYGQTTCDLVAHSGTPDGSGGFLGGWHNFNSVFHPENASTSLRFVYEGLEDTNVYIDNIEVRPRLAGSCGGS